MTRVIRYMLQPTSTFGTPLVGDTLFGQVCWAIRECWGNERLDALLEGYTSDSPFLVLSDAFPHGHLPRPHVPGRFVIPAGVEIDPSARKELKKKAWLPLGAFSKPSSHWLDEAASLDWVYEAERSHNSLDRSTGTTGSGDGFAPFVQEVLRYENDGATLDQYAVLDETRFTQGELDQILSSIGAFGYGRNATTGEGRFALLGHEDRTGTAPFAAVKSATPRMALANVAPQGGAWDASRCWYTPVTRFGRHGAQGALSGRPFKNPILLAATGAVLTPMREMDRPFLGQGIGGESVLSKAIAGTVHQGYAPVVPLNLGVCA